MRGILFAALLLAAPASSGSGTAPEQAVAQTLSLMRRTLRYAPDSPAPRGPHEWDARRVLAAGTVNGCVESAKAFFSLLRRDFPHLRAYYLDSFNSVAEGGHAVVQVEGSDGRDFIVDAAAFESLPGAVTLDEAALAAPVDIRKGRTGRIVQFPGRSDVFLEKDGGAYRMTVYPAYQVFDGKPLSQASFPSLKALNQALADYAAGASPDFAYLRDHGLILPFADAGQEAFVYSNPGGGLARYVVYGRFDRLPQADDAEAREPEARRRYSARRR